MYLCTRGETDAAATFTITAASDLYKQAHGFIYLRVTSTTTLTYFCRRIRIAWGSFRNYTPIELKIQLLKAEVYAATLYGFISWNLRSCPYDALHRAYHKLLTRYIGWRKHSRTDMERQHRGDIV